MAAQASPRLDTPGSGVHLAPYFKVYQHYEPS